MSTNSHGDLAIRLNLYATPQDRQRAMSHLGDLTAQHPFRLEAGWSPAGPNAHVDMDLTGAAEADDIRDLARALMWAAGELYERADAVDRTIIDARFAAIVRTPSADAEGAEPSDAPQGVYPGWAEMPMLDRALAVEHILKSRTLRTGEAPPPLTYAVDERLRSLPAPYAHRHAVHLERTLGIPEGLDDATIADLARVLRDHRDLQGQ